MLASAETSPTSSKRDTAQALEVSSRSLVGVGVGSIKPQRQRDEQILKVESPHNHPTLGPEKKSAEAASSSLLRCRSLYAFDLFLSPKHFHVTLHVHERTP